MGGAKHSSLFMIKKKMTSIKRFAKENNLDYNIVKEFQQMRRRVTKMTLYVRKKDGYTLTLWQPIKLERLQFLSEHVNGFVLSNEKLMECIKEFREITADDIRQKFDNRINNYFSNIATACTEEADAGDYYKGEAIAKLFSEMSVKDKMKLMSGEGSDKMLAFFKDFYKQDESGFGSYVDVDGFYEFLKGMFPNAGVFDE